MKLIEPIVANAAALQALRKDIHGMGAEDFSYFLWIDVGAAARSLAQWRCSGELSRENQDVRTTRR